MNIMFVCFSHIANFVLKCLSVEIVLTRAGNYISVQLWNDCASLYVPVYTEKPQLEKDD